MARVAPGAVAAFSPGPTTTSVAVEAAFPSTAELPVFVAAGSGLAARPAVTASFLAATAPAAEPTLALVRVATRTALVTTLTAGTALVTTLTAGTALVTTLTTRAALVTTLTGTGLADRPAITAPFLAVTTAAAPLSALALVPLTTRTALVTTLTTRPTVPAFLTTARPCPVPALSLLITAPGAAVRAAAASTTVGPGLASATLATRFAITVPAVTLVASVPQAVPGPALAVPGRRTPALVAVAAATVAAAVIGASALRPAPIGAALA